MIIIFFHQFKSDSKLTRFADRDLLMRYRGGGVGHKNISDIEQKLLADRAIVPNEPENWVDSTSTNPLADDQEGNGEDPALSEPIV